METLLDPVTRERVTVRISSLTENSKAQWGKMTLYQMLKHCTLSDEMLLQNKKYKQAWIGKFLGPLLLRVALKKGTPMRANSPTIPELMIKDSGDFATQKKEWIERIRQYAAFKESEPAFIHPFFGKMNREQIGVLAYKHADHHLRQFNA